MSTAHPRMLVTAAFGHRNDTTGHTRVPAGWVGVIASPDGQRRSADERSYLVPDAEYGHSRSSLDPFVIDPERHPEWPALPSEPDGPATVIVGHGTFDARMMRYDRHDQPIYGAAYPHKGRPLGRLWRYPPAGERPATWRAYRVGHGASLAAYATPEEALTAVGLTFAPYATVPEIGA